MADGNITQGLLYFAGAALTGNAAVPGGIPSTLYAYVPKNMTRVLAGGARVVDAAAIKAEGLKPGVEGKVWATSMTPKDFSAGRIGGSWGFDLLNQFPFFRFFNKNFQEGYVVRIKNTGQFSPSTTYWKMLLGQFEANGPISPENIIVEPMHGNTGGGPQ